MKQLLIRTQQFKKKKNSDATSLLLENLLLEN